MTLPVNFLKLTRIISLLALFGLLQACSAVKLAYNQAPELAYWYLDSYADFNSAQSLQVKHELVKLHMWHRQTQLPAYIDTLQKVQKLLPDDVTGPVACAVVDDVRRKLLAVSDQAEPAVGALVDTMQAAQLKQMERKFDKNNAAYREDYVNATAKDSYAKRYKQAVNRAEILYGQLDEKQLALITRQVEQSRFNAALSYAERLRRQQDTLQNLRAVIANPNPGEPTRKAVRALLERSVNSPNMAYRDYLDALTQDGCKSFAELHNITSSEQRRKAVQTLNNYEKDIMTLSVQNKL